MAPEDAVRALYDAFARRDVEAAVATCDPDVSFFPQGTAQRSGRAKGYLGHEGIRAYFEDVERIWERLELDPQDFRVAGQGVVVFGHVSGRLDGEELAFQAIWVFKLRDGRIRSCRAVGTRAAAVAAAEADG